MENIKNKNRKQESIIAKRDDSTKDNKLKRRKIWKKIPSLSFSGSEKSLCEQESGQNWILPRKYYCLFLQNLDEWVHCQGKVKEWYHAGCVGSQGKKTCSCGRYANKN
jgi:hypothetical protein